MANPHHRKKHKAHLKQFRDRIANQTGESKVKAKGSSVAAVGGAIAGFAILFFATQNFIWAILGAVIGAGVGYLIGRNIDRAAKK